MTTFCVIRTSSSTVISNFQLSSLPGLALQAVK